MSLTLHLTKFVNDLKNKNRSNSTITSYVTDIEQLIDFLTSKKINSWEESNSVILEKYLKRLQYDNKLTLKSISRKINSTRTFYKFLISEKQIKEDYSLKLKHPKIPRQIPRILSPLEYKALRDTVKTNIRLYTIIEMLLQTGMRIGELSRLRNKNINKDITLINIEAYSTYPKRQVMINPTLGNVLKNYYKIFSNKNNYVFYTRNGGKILIRNIRSSIDNAFKLTGIQDAKVNDLRNTFIIHQLEAGMQIDKLSQTVGHKHQSTTEYYLEFIKSRPQKTTRSIHAL